MKYKNADHISNLAISVDFLSKLRISVLVPKRRPWPSRGCRPTKLRLNPVRHISSLETQRRRQEALCCTRVAIQNIFSIFSITLEFILPQHWPEEKNNFRIKSDGIVEILHAWRILVADKFVCFINHNNEAINNN